jgi:hypothetical protein
MKSNTMIRVMAVTTTILALAAPAAAGRDNPDWSVTR